MNESNVLNKINVLKRSQAKACIEAAKKYGKIRKMAIFGSSVRDDCTEESDVDICLWVDGATRGKEMYDLASDLLDACGNNCDILTYDRLDNKFQSQIDAEGVIIYELS